MSLYCRRYWTHLNYFISLHQACLSSEVGSKGIVIRGTSLMKAMQQSFVGIGIAEPGEWGDDSDRPKVDVSNILTVHRQVLCGWYLNSQAYMLTTWESSSWDNASAVKISEKLIAINFPTRRFLVYHRVAQFGSAPVSARPTLIAAAAFPGSFSHKGSGCRFRVDSH